MAAFRQNLVVVTHNDGIRQSPPPVKCQAGDKSCFSPMGVDNIKWVFLQKAGEPPDNQRISQRPHGISHIQRQNAGNARCSHMLKHQLINGTRGGKLKTSSTETFKEKFQVG